MNITGRYNALQPLLKDKIVVCGMNITGKYNLQYDTVVYDISITGKYNDEALAQCVLQGNATNVPV